MDSESYLAFDQMYINSFLPNGSEKNPEFVCALILSIVFKYFALLRSSITEQNIMM